MKKILPILTVAFLAGCTVTLPSVSSQPVSSEETTSQVTSSQEVSSEELISSEVISSEEVSSSDITSSEEVSSSEEVGSSEEVSSSEEVTSSEVTSSSEVISSSEEISSSETSSEVLPTFTIDVIDNLVDLPDNITISHVSPVEQGTIITITAEAIDGYNFIHWLIPDSEIIASTQATVEIPVTNNIALMAIYEAIVVEVFAPDLFISEYIEGTSNNKAFEIANFTGAAIDLTAYTIQLYGNGSLTTTRPVQALTGTLNHGEVFVIAGDSITDPGMVAALNAIAAEKKLVSDFAVGSIAESYNGDDAFALLKNGVIIDVFGTIGFDPGTGWDQYTYGLVADGVTVTTVDRTLTRLPGFGPKVGTINNLVAFDPIEWGIGATHTQTLGTHIFN